MTDAPERIWACAGKRGGNRYWVGPGELYQAAHEVGPYVRADLHAAALAREAALREALRDTLDFVERHSNRWDGSNGKHPALIVEAALAALGAQP